jgi:hypothetical protein
MARVTLDHELPTSDADDRRDDPERGIGFIEPRPLLDMQLEER